jgi:two-component system sensor histidine kinase KdpD
LAPGPAERTHGAAAVVQRIISKPVWRYLAALGVVAGSAVAAELLFRLTGSNRLSMVFLAGVLLAAYGLGSGPAYLAAGAAFFVYNFYLVEPRFSVTFESEDVITLAVFLAVAMLTGNLTGRVRDQAARAQARAKATSDLFEATREFSGSSEETFIRERLAVRLAAAARGEAVVKDRTSLALSNEAVAPDPRLLADLAAFEGPKGGAASQPSLEGGWLMRQLRTEEGPLGVAAWRTLGEPLTSDEETLLEILADVGAAAMARAKLATGKAQAEARARTEDLRNALLSSISHDLRTPLAAVLASASSLHEFGESFSPDVRRDLAATIQEEAMRLDASVANLLNMTRLEAGAVAIQKVTFSLPEVVRNAVERRSRFAAQSVSLTAEPALADAVGDPVLFEVALGNVLDNALRYSDRGQPVSVHVAGQADRLEVHVRDEGPGVPSDDLDRIFQKFYRSPAAAAKPGTGLGLAIARGLIEAMDGTVTAENRDDRRGLHLTIILPQAAA